MTRTTRAGNSVERNVRGEDGNCVGASREWHGVVARGLELRDCSLPSNGEREGILKRKVASLCHNP